MCKISIVIPAYNAEETIGRMLDSIRGQSFQDWQAILVDDGSQDGTGDIMGQYAAMDERFIVIRQANGGVSSARNAGMDHARGQYLYFADADDELEAECLTLLFQAASQTQADLTACGFKYVNGDGQALGTWLPIKQESVNDYCVDWIKRCGINTLCNKLLVRKRVKNQFDTGHSMGEDLKFACDYLGGVQSIAIVERPLYIYYSENSGSLTKNTALRMKATMYDIGNLAAFAYKRLIPAGVIADRFYRRIMESFNDCANRASFFQTFRLLTALDGMLEYAKRYKPDQRKYKWVRAFLNTRSAGILYTVFAMKRLISPRPYSGKEYGHEDQ